uniref:Uncharacterized protein IVSP1-1 n=1 Tax=Hyposoter didymator TaxID=260305 RepID=D7P5L9_HYPDD|nr:unknown [Hyposoter didymator]
MDLDFETIAKIAEAFPAADFASDGNADNQLGDSTEIQKEGNKHLRFVKMLYGLIIQAHVLSWVAAGMFILGSLSDLYLQTSYITDHIIVGIGSVLWILYAYSKHNYPVLLQNLIVGGISVYVFLRHLNMGKFAYLIAALLCMSCAVNRHENVMISTNPNIIPSQCSNISNAASNHVIAMRSNSHPPICELEVIGKVLDEKIKVIGELQQILDGVAESSGTGQIVNHNYDDMYKTARNMIDSVLKDVRSKMQKC